MDINVPEIFTALLVGVTLSEGGGLLYSNNVIFLQYQYTMAREIIAYQMICVLFNSYANCATSGTGSVKS
jgi:hypothetical protein